MIKIPMIHLVSFSGGKDSTAMLLRMMELGMKIDKVIYCDTWMDFPDMYEHIAKIKMMVKDIGIDFVELKNPKSFKYFLLEHPVKRRKPIKGNPKGYSWADSRSRWCTSKMKLDLINKYISNLSKNYNVVQYVGIAADEQRRLKREHNTNIRYPLVDWNWTEEDALNYCYQKGYDWNGLYKIFKRASCWCCPLQSLADLRKLKNISLNFGMNSKKWISRLGENLELIFLLLSLRKDLTLKIKCSQRDCQSMVITKSSKES